MAYRQQKLMHLANILEVCHTNNLTFKTPAIADKIAQMIRPLALGDRTAKEYVRLLIDALAWEDKNSGVEFKFATN